MVQALQMMPTTGTVRTLAAAPGRPLPERHQGREVGWIFSHGGSVIERPGTEIRSQVSGH